MESKQELKRREREASLIEVRKCEGLIWQQLDLGARADARSLPRRLHQERQETKFEEKVLKFQEMRKLSQNQCSQEEKLAQEIDLLKRKEMREKKDRLRIRETSHELRELERKLKSAYAVKSLYAQLAEKEAMRIYEKKREVELLKQLTDARVKEEVFRKQMRQQEMERKEKLRKEIQDQIVASHQMKLCSYEQYLQDKKLIDDISDKINQEDMKAEEERMIKQQKTRQEMEEFKKAREFWKKKERDRIEEENRKIAEYMNQKDEVVKTVSAKTLQLERQKEIVYNKFVENKKKEEEEVKFREDIINTLIEEGAKAKAEADRVTEMEEAHRKKLEMRRCLDKQKQMKEEAARKEAEDDKVFREALAKKMAEDARLEQLSDAKRRMKQLELGRAIEAMMEERRVKRAEEMQQAIKLYEYDQDEEKKRLRIVEEERLRMLKEHVRELGGFLPKGLLKPEDYKHLGPLLECIPNESSNPQ